MGDPILDELNSTTYQELWDRNLQDNFFKNAPTLAYLRNSNSFVAFSGGAFLQMPFVLAGTIGGWFSQGASFNLAKPQLLGDLRFDLKQVEDNITEELIELSLNRGPLARFSLVDTHMSIAMNTINSRINISLWRHGQASASTVSDNRVLYTNGFSEIYNDGVTNSWDGNIFTTYGTATRTASIYNSGLNSIPYFCGEANGAAGSITYNIFTERYLNATRGNESPNLIIMNKAAFAFILEKMQTQQRFTGMEKDPVWGASGFRFHDAMVLVDDYCPSATSQYGVNDANIGNYSTSTFTSAASGIATSSNLPASKTITVGEVVFMINTNKLFFRLSDDPLFQFGFTGFKTTADSVRVSGQVLAQLNLEASAPWSGEIIYGINS